MLHLFIHNIRDTFNFLIHIWYLDDGTVVEDLEEVAKSLNVNRKTGLRLGLELNIRKTKIFCH